MWTGGLQIMPVVFKRGLHASQVKFLACPDCGAFVLLNHMAITTIPSRYAQSLSDLRLIGVSSKIPWRKQDA